MAKAKQSEVNEQEPPETLELSTFKPEKHKVGSTTFTHHLFRLETAVLLKNISYISTEPNLERVDHMHFYHSHDAAGVKQKNCVAVGGHFHELTNFRMDGEGKPIADCGPPMKMVQRKNKAGKWISEASVITFYDGKRDEEIVDDHRHEITYLGWEEINTGKVKQAQIRDREKLDKLDPRVKQVREANAQEREAE